MGEFELLIFGGMFSGKTRSLIHNLRYVHLTEGLEVAAFKHAWDLDRYAEQMKRQAEGGSEGVAAVHSELVSYDRGMHTFPAWGVGDIRRKTAVGLGKPGTPRPSEPLARLLKPGRIHLSYESDYVAIFS